MSRRARRLLFAVRRLRQRTRSDAALPARRHRAGRRRARRDPRRHRSRRRAQLLRRPAVPLGGHRRRLRGARRRRHRAAHAARHARRHARLRLRPDASTSACCRRSSETRAAAHRSPRAPSARQRHDRPDRRARRHASATARALTVDAHRHALRRRQPCDANQACCDGVVHQRAVGRRPTAAAAAPPAARRRQLLGRHLPLRRRLGLQRAAPPAAPAPAASICRPTRSTAAAAATPATRARPASAGTLQVRRRRRLRRRRRCAAPTAAPARRRAAARAARTACSFPNVCCNAATGSCVDTKSDNSNCGACGHACTAPLSLPATAPARATAPSAPPATPAARAAAPTPRTIRNNCGALRQALPRRRGLLAAVSACAAARRARAGQLLLRRACCTHAERAPTAAPAATSARSARSCTRQHVHLQRRRELHRQPDLLPGRRGRRGGGCFDLSNDPKHCGDCSRRCTPGDACVHGPVHADAVQPAVHERQHLRRRPVPLQRQRRLRRRRRPAAPHGCKDLSNDPANCNACGKTCGKGDLLLRRHLHHARQQQLHRLRPKCRAAALLHLLRLPPAVRRPAAWPLRLPAATAASRGGAGS